MDYPKIIKQPMDLGTIAKKIKKKQYETLFEVHDDARLVWENCMTYNADGSDFYKLADSLKKSWDTKYHNLLTDLGTQLPTGGAAPKVSLQDKRQFAKLLYAVSKEDLGILLIDLERMAPSSITRNQNEDELELNIDAIPGQVMAELLKTLNGYSKKKKPVTNKAKKQKM